MICISRRKDSSHCLLEHPAEARRNPPPSRYRFRLARSDSSRAKAPSPVMMAKGYWKTSASASLTGLNLRAVLMVVSRATRVRNLSEKQTLLRVPA